ncbi:MAG: hypothetical protein ACREUG_07830 [Steroidobacteraceae bacterium]
MTDALRAALQFAAGLESCKLRYVVGGSVASSIVGEPRSTLDVDFAVELPESVLGDLAVALSPDFYFDVEAAHHAVRTATSTNAIHEPTGVKVDLFVAHTRLDRLQMDRRLSVAIGPSGPNLYVCTPEDILLQKLRWYRLGGEVSDRQWRDVLGIILTVSGALDRPYLEREASELDVADLLARAFTAG